MHVNMKPLLPIPLLAREVETVAVPPQATRRWFQKGAIFLRPSLSNHVAKVTLCIFLFLCFFFLFIVYLFKENYIHFRTKLLAPV